MAEERLRSAGSRPARKGRRDALVSACVGVRQDEHVGPRGLRGRIVSVAPWLSGLVEIERRDADVLLNEQISPSILQQDASHVTWPRYAHVGEDLPILDGVQDVLFESGGGNREQWDPLRSVEADETKFHADCHPPD